MNARLVYFGKNFKSAFSIGLGTHTKAPFTQAFCKGCWRWK